MQRATLADRARTLLRERSKLVTGLAAVPLVAAPGAQAFATIMIDPGTVTINGAPGTTTTIDPLAAFAGNGTNTVSIAGSARAESFDFTTDINDSSIVFENTGSVDATAGQAIRVDYDFDQMFDSTSGGTYDLGFDLLLTVTVPSGDATGGDSGAINGIVNSFNFSVNQSGSFMTTAFGEDLIGAQLDFSLTSTYTLTQFASPLELIGVDVPQSSISFTLVPEPSSLLLLSGGLMIALLFTRARALGSWIGATRT